MDQKYENGKFEDFEMPEWEEKEEFNHYLNRIGYKGILNWWDSDMGSAIGIEVYVGIKRRDFVVNVDIGDWGYLIYTPTFSDFISLLNLLAPLRELSRREAAWTEKLEEKIEKERRNRR